ncbi:MAG: sigma 54-interacting transcriptional regulator [Tolumonas sp.]|nr:sigma 54-interacting transcriptional regulator [Tolumonas sp.]
MQEHTAQLIIAIEPPKLEEHRQHKAQECKSRKAHSHHSVGHIISHSPAMKQMLEMINQIAPTRSAVLLRGEPGTGKDVIARTIHAQSQNKQGPFIKVCCEHISDEQLMLDLFGCEADFLPGITQSRQGRVSQAVAGTLFLSEIGHFSLAMQSRLLRILQEQKYEPLGSSHAQSSDIRVICASEKNLETLVLQERFLPELYYRIHVASIALPSLRERAEDLPDLVRYFFERYNKANGKNISIAQSAMEHLYACDWPGNVRDLENCLEHAALLSKSDVIQQLPCATGQCIRRRLNQTIQQTETLKAPINGLLTVGPALGESAQIEHRVGGASAAYKETDRSRLVMALEKCGWVKAKAARHLGITPRQLGYALQKLQIEVKKY